MMILYYIISCLYLGAGGPFLAVFGNFWQTSQATHFVFSAVRACSLHHTSTLRLKGQLEQISNYHSKSPSSCSTVPQWCDRISLSHPLPLYIYKRRICMHIYIYIYIYTYIYRNASAHIYTHKEK